MHAPELGLAAAGFCIGALPLVVYNVLRTSNLSLQLVVVLSQFPKRLHALRITWDGEILWDYMVHAPWAPGMQRRA